MLSADHLYAPDIHQKPADADIHDWLNEMLLPNQKNRIQTQPRIISQAIIEEKEPDIIKEFVITDNDAKYLSYLSAIIENPAYDVNDIENLTGGQGLFYITWSIFQKCNFFTRFRIKESKFINWILKIQCGYIRENPYHNSIHASDVTHAMYYYISKPKIWNFLCPEEQLAAIIAPIIHDYAHPGVNNGFLVSILDPLAIKYSDLSVLEHFHASSVFEIMLQDEYNILDGLTNDERKLVREGIISMVLATDMTFHFDWIGKFKTKMSGNGLNLEQKSDRKLLLNMAIKCSDVNNPSKPLEQCKVWTELVMEEFFRQGDREKVHGIPISMFYSRGTDIPKCQIVFIFNARDL